MEIDDQEEVKTLVQISRKTQASVNNPETFKIKRAKSLIVKERLKHYRNAITKGCGRFACPSPYCKSNLSQTITKLNGEDEKADATSDKVLSMKTIELLKTKTPLCSSHPPVSLDAFLTIINNNPSSQKSRAILTQLYNNLATFENSFISETIDEKEALVTKDSVSIDFSALNKFHSCVFSDVELCKIAKKGLNGNLTSYARKIGKQRPRSHQERTANWLHKLRVLLLLMEHPLILSYDPDSYDLLYKFGTCWMETKNDREQLSAWISQYDLEHLTRIKDHLMQYVTVKYEEKRAALPQRGRSYDSSAWDDLVIWTTDVITPICTALDAVYHANFRKYKRDKHSALGYKEFYNDSLNEASAENREFQVVTWILYRQENFDFYPWLLDVGAKADLLILHSKQNNRDYEPCLLTIARDRIIQDSLKQLQWLDGATLRRQLKVAFAGEQGVDEGGVTKEYFTLLVREIMDIQYGMFFENQETRQFWFNSSSFTFKEEFELIGMIFGLAIYHGVIIEAPFPSLLFKKLLNFPLDFDDFMDFDPTMARTLNKLRTFEEADLKGVGLTFIYSHSRYGENIVHELKPDGDKIPVTSENVNEYIELTWRWMLEGSIKTQFDAFRGGFCIVMQPKTLKIFWPEELELLVKGKKVYDWKALEESCKYDGGFTRHHRYIKSFWKLIHSLEDQDKRKFLAFCTGSDRVPVRGLSNVKMTIARNGSDDEKFPTSHTCFSVLLLPEYSTREILEKKLGIAIANYTGFGIL